MIDEEDEDEDDDDWIKVDHGALDKPKMFEKDAEINHPLVVKKLIEIMAARGDWQLNFVNVLALYLANDDFSC